MITRRLSKIKVVLSVFIAFALISLFTSYKDGPALNNKARTGAPFNSNKTCSDCHSGGNFGSSIITRLYRSDSTQVTSYTPNQQYYFVIVFRNTIGNPNHGFQTTCATAEPASLNLNRWTGAPGLPPNTANRVLSGRNYVEHTTPLSVDTLIIPWKAPAAGTGTVVFYTAANFINGNNKTSGDQPVNTTLTVTEATTPSITAPKIPASSSQRYSLMSSQIHGRKQLVFFNAGKAQSVLLTYRGENGKIIKTAKVSAAEGSNLYPLFTDHQGKYHVSAVTQGNHQTILTLHNGQ